MPTATSTVAITLAQFDSHPHPLMSFEVPRRGVPISNYQPLTLNDYMPRGGTPLRDATAQFITTLGELEAKGTVQIGILLDRSGSMSGNQHAVVAGVNEFVAGMGDVEVDPEADGQVLAVIFTDGFENSSREISPDALRTMIAEREKRGWTFIYLGANQDAWSEADGLGYSGGAGGQSVNFVSSPTGTASALTSTSDDAKMFLSDNAGYKNMRKTSSKRSLTEDGQEISDAIKRAKGEK